MNYIKLLIFGLAYLLILSATLVFSQYTLKDAVLGDTVNVSVIIDDENGDLRDLSSDTTYLRLYESLPTGNYPTFPADIEFTFNNSDAVADPSNGVTVLRIRPYDYAGFFSEAWYEDDSGTDTKLAYYGDTSNADEYLNNADNDFTFAWDTDDYLYLGHIERFRWVTTDLATLGIAGTLTWEYWDNSTWSALTTTNLAYGADDFLYSGTFNFTPPADWTSKVITEVSGRVWRSCYYIRCSENDAFSTDPIENKITIGGIKARTYSMRIVTFDGNTFKYQHKFDNKWIVRAN